MPNQNQNVYFVAYSAQQCNSAGKYNIYNATDNCEGIKGLRVEQQPKLGHK